MLVSVRAHCVVCVCIADCVLQVQGGKCTPHTPTDAEVSFARNSLAVAAKCVEKYRRKHFADMDYTSFAPPASASTAVAETESEITSTSDAAGDGSADMAAESTQSAGDLTIERKTESASTDASVLGAGGGKSRKSKTKSSRYVPAPFLYARIDILSSADGKDLFVNEMELLDCELFFRFNKAAADKMTAAIVARVAELKKLSAS